MAVDPSVPGAAGSGNGRMAGSGQTPNLRWTLSSDPGPFRDHNEDCAGTNAHAEESGPMGGPGPIFVVADGLGGHAAGEVASRVAVAAALHSWSTASGDAAKAIRAAARAANGAVVDASISSGNHGMGTTLTALAVVGADAVIAHVGDTRVYRSRGDSCVQLTNDHSRVGEMLRMKLISVDQAARHPARSQLTRSLGAGMVVQIDLVREKVEPGDTFIVCTDGLWDEVGNVDMARVVADTERTDAAEQLVALAIERGSADNVTAVVVTVVSALPETRPADKRSLFRRRG